MFARLNVPCVSVVENMSYFDGDDGKRYYPFGAGSGERIMREFAIPHLTLMPIREEVSNGSDRGVPCVLQDPDSEISKTMGNLADNVVQEVGKMKRERKMKNEVAYDPSMHEMHCTLLKEDPVSPPSVTLIIHPFALENTQPSTTVQSSHSSCPHPSPHMHH